MIYAKFSNNLEEWIEFKNWEDLGNAIKERGEDPVFMHTGIKDTPRGNLSGESKSET